MSYTTPQLDAAEAVATLLTGRTIADLVVSASSADLLPKYDLSDLSTLRVDCVAASPFSLLTESPVNRAAVEEECLVNVGVQMRCGPEDVTTHRQLKALLRGIAAVLAFEPVPGFGRPRADIQTDESAEILESDGRFFGIVSAEYRVVTEADT